MRFGKTAFLVIIILSSIVSVSITTIAQNENILVRVNFLVIDDGVTDLVANATFNGDTDPVGEIDPVLPQIFDLNILIILNQIYSQCNISFELATVKVLRPELLISPLRPDRNMLDPFGGDGREKFLELNNPLSFLNEFALFTVQPQGQPAPFDLFTQGPHLTMFVVGASLTSDGESGVLAIGQLNGRHSTATYRTLIDINNPAGVTVIAHEWGHNLGLLHTDEDGLEETDDETSNLMFPSINLGGLGNRRLTSSQCEIARNSPLLKTLPQFEADTLRVPQDFERIQDALIAAPIGSTIELAAGVYEETVFIEKPVRLTTSPGAEVTLIGDPNNNLSALVIENASDVVIDGLSISERGVLIRNSLDITLSNNQISNNEFGVFSFNARININSNTVSNNRIGILLVDGADSTVSDNLVLSNNRGSQAAGIFLQNSIDISILNNIVQGNQDGVLILFGSVAELSDNIISGNSSFGLGLDGSSSLSLCSGNQINDPVSPADLRNICAT